MESETSDSSGVLVRRSASDRAFGCPRAFHGNRFVYTVISPRARGLSVGINLNPDRRCNFDCMYCEVDRSCPTASSRVDLEIMARELEWTLDRVHGDSFRFSADYAGIPRELLRLKHVALSGDGEPTLSADFLGVVETVVHLRARGLFPFFKLVLITNASGLDRPEVRAGLRLLTPRDEIWAKLETGTPDYMARLHRPDCSLGKIIENILQVALERPVIIQSLFPSLQGVGPGEAEIEAYARQLKQLRERGARLSLVQIYSATRPTPHSECGHLPLRTLSSIASKVRTIAGLPAEVY